MTPLQFIAQLTGLSSGIAAVLYFVHREYPVLAKYALFSWAILWFFVVFSSALFIAGRMSSKSRNKQLFGQLFMVFTFVKMMGSVIGTAIYFFCFHPDSKWFVVPFFAIYICYTIFEIHFMGKLANS